MAREAVSGFGERIERMAGGGWLAADWGNGLSGWLAGVANREGERRRGSPDVGTD